MKRYLIPLLLLAGCAAGRGDGGVDDDSARAAKTQPGSPPLTGPAAGAHDRVAAFVQWASNSTPSDAAEVRRALAGARNDGDVVAALADQAVDPQDHSRALIALALLGEMRSPQAEAHLRRIVAMPLPASSGAEDDPRASVEILQAKAVDGLAYLQSPSADAEVLRIAGGHESRAVRAEAIDAYLYNHGDSPAARAALAAVIAKTDTIFLDRPRHVAGETAEAFDAKLAAFLTAHPEIAAPPVPAKREEVTP